MKKEFIINPHIGLGNIKFGMKKKEIHALLGSPSYSFYKRKSHKKKSEEYKDIGVFIYYDDDDLVSAIEVWNEPALLFEGNNLFDFQYKRLIDFFSAKDSNIEFFTDGFNSKSFGISFWYEDEITDDSICSSIYLY